MWGNRTFKTLCVCAAIQPLILSGGGSRALVLHRHGNYGLHLHIVSGDVLEPGNVSSLYGHSSLPSVTRQISSSSERGVTYLLPAALAPTHDPSEEQRDLLAVVAEQLDPAVAYALHCASSAAKATLALRGAAPFDGGLRAFDLLQYDLPLLI